MPTLTKPPPVEWHCRDCCADIRAPVRPVRCDRCLSEKVVPLAPAADDDLELFRRLVGFADAPLPPAGQSPHT